MKIRSIVLQNYRNYENLELSFDDSRNIIIGENAQGKTNLVEAIYMCSFAKSFRTNNSQDLVRFDAPDGRINAELESDGLESNLNIVINRQGKKMIKKNGKIVRRTADLLNNMVVIIFSPEDLRIIKDNPEKRRSFINKEISQLRPKYYECLRNYNEALKQKNALLKNNNGMMEDDVLDVFDEQLAINGYEIVKYRRKFTSLLSDSAAEIQRSISRGKEELIITYDETCPCDSAEEMNKMITSSREKDIYYRSSSIGPHRDDIEFHINGKNAKKYGSQGQQRTIALSLKLAEVKIARDVLGENPVLIMDDVLSELDIERQKFLVNEIDDVQLFITSTDLNNEIADKMKDASLFNVESGNITKINRY